MHQTPPPTLQNNMYFIIMIKKSRKAYEFHRARRVLKVFMVALGCWEGEMKGSLTCGAQVNMSTFSVLYVDIV